MALRIDISTDLGPNATLGMIEDIVYELRIASEVALKAENRRVRSETLERLKFPTNSELSQLTETLRRSEGEGDDLRDRARAQLEAREYYRMRLREFGPREWDLLFDERLFKLPPGIMGRSGLRQGWAQAALLGVGMDVADPALYNAMVSAELAVLLPEPLTVVSLRYENPFWGVLRGAKNAEKVAETTVGVLETAATLGPTRRMAKVEATVAEQTLDIRLEERELDVALKREALRRAALENEMLEQQVRSIRASNAIEEQRARLILGAARRGDLHVAEAIRELGEREVRALSNVGNRALEISTTKEPESA